MTGYLLDTNAWIALLKNQPGVLAGVRRVGTRNVSEFSRVAGLRIENWQDEP